MADRAAHGTLPDTALLGSAGNCKWIASIDRRIPENKVHCSMVRTAWLSCDDLDGSFAGSCQLRGVWILVDPNLLDGRRRSDDARNLHSVHDHLRPIGA